MSVEMTDYGIQTEQTDLRVHVCFGEGFIYVYPTANGLEAADSGRWPKVQAKQPGVDGATAEGFLVPPNAIEGCVRVEIPKKWLANLNCGRELSTSAKGAKALALVQVMLKRAKLPVHLGSLEIGDQELQVQGTDLLISARLRLQIKCDYDGGRDGSGNLFLQTAERNPKRAV